MVFLSHTDTVILLEPCCGTITEPGLPVFFFKRKRIGVAERGLSLLEFFV